MHVQLNAILKDKNTKTSTDQKQNQDQRKTNQTTTKHIKQHTKT